MGADDCQAILSRLTPCEHNQRYIVSVWQAGTASRVHLKACVPCAATLRMTHGNDAHHLRPEAPDGKRWLEYVRDIALPHADHEHYRPEWRP